MKCCFDSARAAIRLTVVELMFALHAEGVEFPLEVEVRDAHRKRVLVQELSYHVEDCAAATSWEYPVIVTVRDQEGRKRKTKLHAMRQLTFDALFEKL